MEDFTQGSVEGILYSIITEASEFFAECPGDFCVQHVTDTVNNIEMGSGNYQTVCKIVTDSIETA
jgi:hypothetical protein